MLTINTVYQLAAHFREHPEDFRESAFLPMPDALGFALGGVFPPNTPTVRPPTCSIRKPAGGRRVIAKLGLPRGVFPEIVPPCTFGGTLSPELQKELGCGPVPLIKVGSHDTASAVAAVPAPRQGNWAYISAGTWALLGAELDHPS